MDIEHFTHRGYGVSLVIAVILSAMVVTLASVIGRGTLNLHGALIVSEPRDTTVIALVEPKLDPSVKISEIDFLRKELLPSANAAAAEDPKAKQYSYNVGMSDGAYYLVQLIFDRDENHWVIRTYERLRPGSSDETGADHQ